MGRGRGVAIDCPQGRMQNVNTHLRWGGGQEGRGLDEQVMGRTDGGASGGGEKVNGVREGQRHWKGREKYGSWMNE